MSSTTTVPGSVNILKPVTHNDTVIHMNESPYYIEAKSENTVAYIPIVSETFPDRFGMDSIQYLARWQSSPNNRWFFSLDERMKIPWNFFRLFKYPTKIWVFAVDENFFDYYTSGVTSKLFPEPPVYHFEGADVMGYFGSASVDSFHVTVLPGSASDYWCQDSLWRTIPCP